MTRHVLKTLDVYWDAVQAGTKRFEVRKNDRGFQTGDILELQRWHNDGLGLTQDTSRQPIQAVVIYLLQGGQFGIDPGYCVLGIRCGNFFWDS